MKKILCLFAAIALICGVGLTSCSKSNDKLIEEYSEVCNDITKAVKDGDLVKVGVLAEKGQKIEKELNERDLTDEQKEEVAKIALKMASEAAQSASEQMGF